MRKSSGHHKLCLEMWRVINFLTVKVLKISFLKILTIWSVYLLEHFAVAQTNYFFLSNGDDIAIYQFEDEIESAPYPSCFPTSS